MKNSYVTRADFLLWASTQNTAANTNDDLVIDDILEATSRYIDGQTHRKFYPRVQARSFNTPTNRELLVDDDLLAITTLTNGDDNTIASTEYNLFPKNDTPYYGIKLIGSSSTIWESDSSSNTEWVIDVLGEWGYHDDYADHGWTSGGTLGAAITDTTTLAFTATAGHSLVAGQVIKIGTEIQIVSSVSTNTITPLARGDNGSTAATHLNGAAISIWNPQPDIVQATKLIAQSLYRRFNAPNQGDESIVTASGVIITPKDVPGVAARIIRLYQRLN
jgi:hypothetical protein